MCGIESGRRGGGERGGFWGGGGMMKWGGEVLDWFFWVWVLVLGGDRWWGGIDEGERMGGIF